MMQLFNHQAAKDGIEYIVDIRNISMFFPSLISIEWSKVKHANAYIIAFHTHIYIYRIDININNIDIDGMKVFWIGICVAFPLVL